MSALSLSRENRARHVLKICELAARNLTPDIEDVDDPSMQDLSGAYQVLVRKLKYLIPRASAQWLPEFECALEDCHSMRIEKIEVNRKEAIRGNSMKCMACGKVERNCRYAIDIAGSFKPKEWLNGVHRVHEQYNEFRKEYKEVFDPYFGNDCIAKGILPAIDKGTYIVGQTCLRKAKLRYLLQTLLLETCYEAERQIESVRDGGCEIELGGSVLYTLTEERCSEFVETQDNLDLATADDERAVPDIAIDEDFWDIIDQIRNEISNGDEDTFNEIIRARAHSVLKSFKFKGVGTDRECDEDRQHSRSVADEDDQNATGDHQKLSNVRTESRKRACVVDDESDDESGNALETQKHSTRCVKAKATRVSSDSPSQRAAGPSSPVPTEVETEECPARRVSSRETQAPISGIVGRMRADGSLPSRSDVILDLMKLQAQLQREGRLRDTFTCTRSIITLQELTRQVEEMRHTAL